MKKLSMLLLGCIVVLPAFSQVNRDHQCIRTGDEIIKQQVEYRSSGEPGSNKFWDFSRLKTINDEYRLIYCDPPLQGDSLYILGASGVKPYKYNYLAVVLVWLFIILFLDTSNLIKGGMV